MQNCCGIRHAGEEDAVRVCVSPSSKVANE